MRDAITRGPIAIGMEANRNFMQYKSGVFNDFTCGQNLNHIMAVIGFGNENGQDYFLVKNTSGINWGDQGYVKMAATPGAGVCGMNLRPVQPFV